MRIAFYMNCLSAHQLPLAKEVAELIGCENFVYVDAGEQSESAQSVGDTGGIEVKVLNEGSRVELENVEMLYTGLRDMELFERRATKWLRTFYTSERWFKPPLGRFRMLVPSYRRMVKRFVAWANTDPGARVLAIGPWAKRDFLRMGVREEKLVKWGYFVEPSKLLTQVADATRKVGQDLNAYAPRNTADGISTSCPAVSPKQLKVLWAGRDIPLKHVGDIERAVALANKNLKSSVHLDLGSSPKITFTKLTGVTPAEVRTAMRSHDTFVFASNGYEGWGAVVSEALEEGMNAIGTYECGAPPTLLPKERLYHCGDVRALAKLLELEVEGLRLKVEGQKPILPDCTIGDWTARKAAQRLINLI